MNEVIGQRETGRIARPKYEGSAGGNAAFAPAASIIAPITAAAYVTPASASAILRVDIGAIVDNYRIISRQVAPAQVAAVVKADCYGLGAAQICPALKQAGCRHFFVAHLAEAQALRPILGADCALYILNGLVPGAEEECIAANAAGTGASIIPVLNSPNQITRWAAMARIAGQPLLAALQVDSGMSRLGLQPCEIEDLFAHPERLEGLDLRFIMSHFACADTPDAPSNDAQTSRFAAIAERFPGLGRSLDNSSGSFLPHHEHGDIVRPGIALYGGAVQADQPNPMRPVVSLTARILQIRTIEAGTGVGYGLTYSAPQAKTIIATIGVGYADGWPRALSNQGSVFINGIRVSIAGRVSMDSMTLDVTHVPAELLFPGAVVELLGPHQTIDDVANDAGTISYEILTQLSHRYWRVYEGAQEA